MISRTWIAVLAIVLWRTSVVPAALTTINFESFAGMTAPTGPVPSGSQLSNQLLGSGLIFASDSPYVAVRILGADATSGVNGIAGINASGDKDNSAILITFFVPASSTPAVTDFVSVRADLHGTGPSSTLEAFDFQGTLLGTDTQSDVGGQTMSITSPGIHSIRLSSADKSVAFDDLTFGTPLSPVPEPAAVSLVVMSIMFFGWCRDRVKNLVEVEPSGETGDAPPSILR